MEKNMKQSKNKPSVTNVVVNSITALNLENSNDIAYSTQGRVLKGMCYSFTNDLRYVKGIHRQKFAEYGILKEDSRGDESTANSLQKLKGYLNDLESQAEDLIELKEAAYLAHYELFDTNYSVPIKGSSMQATRQEIDSDWEPKQL
jgi:hypothetical protein